jgi:hypothetical protein
LKEAVMDAGEEFFARVRPLLGKGLEGKHVRVEHPSLAAPLLEMLHACLLDGISVANEDEAPPWPHLVDGGWSEHLAGKNPWKPLVVPSTEADATLQVRLGTTARVEMHAASHTLELTIPRGDMFTAMDVLTHAAWMLKDVLTGKAAWNDQAFSLGDARWPFAVAAPADNVEAPALRKGLHVMVVGCGSLGSEAVRLLQPQVAKWTLVDAGKVTVFNLNRQWFSSTDLGRSKVESLRARLSVPVHACASALENAADMEALLDEQRPDVVLLATGTHHHAALAEVLWKRGIPHVAVCCYPQARFFEVVVVDPSRGTPCFDCLRGHLFRGAPAPAPMTDEVAGFVYSSPDDATRAARFVDLVAEPATRMDTFRAANVAARAVTALAAVETPLWMARAVEEGTTCLLGCNTPVTTEDGGWAYGISQRGQVLRLGLPDLAGTTERETCGCCGRDVRMVHVEEVVTAPVPEQDEAMMNAMGG